jgi:Phage stabilisation protein
MTSQVRINCYINLRPDKDKTEFSVLGTPGLTLFASCPSYPIRGIYTLSNGQLMYVACGNQLVSVNGAGIVATVGTINTNTNPVTMIDNGTQMLVLDGTTGRIVTLATGVMVNIVDANFPQAATSCCFNDTYFFVNDPTTVGAFRGSSLNDGTTWPALNQAIAQSNPDPVLWVAELHGLLVIFGILSIEWWQDLALTPGLPYAPIKVATQDYGLHAKYSVSYFNDSLIFLGRSDDGKVSVYMFEGFRVMRVSTDDIDSIISRMTISSDAVGMTYYVDGHLMYQVSFPTANRSFIFDGSSRVWSETQSGIAQMAGRHTASCAASFNGRTYMGSSSGPQIYQVDPLNFTENGSAIQRILQTRHIFDDANMLGISDLFLDMETGVGLQAGQGSNPQIMLSVSKDGGRTFGNERWTSIGAVGQYIGPRVTWRRLGAGRDFIFQWKMTDPVKFAISNAAITPDVGVG